MSADPSFLYPESEVAKKIGAERRVVREQRELHLEEGIDWKKNGRDILLSQSGLERIEKLFGVSVDLEKKTRRFKVVAIPMNRRMVLANESGDWNDERELIDVGNHKNFCIGDEIDVEPHEAQQGIWRCLSRIPRDTRRPSVPSVSLRSPIQLFDKIPPDIT